MVDCKVLLLLSFVLPLLSQNVMISLDFVGTDGDWNNASNWSPPIVPDASNSTIQYTLNVYHGVHLNLPPSPTFHTLSCTGCLLTVTDSHISGTLLLDFLSTLNIHGSLTGSGQLTGGHIHLASPGASLGLPVLDAHSLSFSPGSQASSVTSSIPTIISGGSLSGPPSILHLFLSSDLGDSLSIGSNNLTVQHLYWSGSVLFDNLLVSGSIVLNNGPYSVEGLLRFSPSPNSTVEWSGSSLSYGPSAVVDLAHILCTGNESCSFTGSPTGRLNLKGKVDASSKGGPNSGVVLFEGGIVSSYCIWDGSIMIEGGVFNVEEGSAFKAESHLVGGENSTLNINVPVTLPHVQSDSKLFINVDDIDIDELRASGEVTAHKVYVDDEAWFERATIRAGTFHVMEELVLIDFVYMTNATLEVMRGTLVSTSNFSLYLIGASTVNNNGTWTVNGGNVYIDTDAVFYNHHELIFLYGDFIVQDYLGRGEGGRFVNIGIFHANDTKSDLYFEGAVPFYQCSSGVLRLSSRDGDLPLFHFSPTAVIYGSFEFRFDSTEDYEAIPESGLTYGMTKTRLDEYGQTAPLWGANIQNTYIAGEYSILAGINCQDISSSSLTLMSYYHLEDYPFSWFTCADSFPAGAPRLDCDGVWNAGSQPLISFSLLLALLFVLL